MKLNRTMLLGAFTAAALFAVPACDDKKADTKAEAKKDEKKAEMKEEKAEMKEEKAEMKEEKAEDGGGGADAIGIPECDEYITKYIKCIDEKMPEAAREQTKKAVEQSVDAWKQAAAAGGPGKDALAQTCKTALDTAKKATEQMGCEW